MVELPKKNNRLALLSQQEWNSLGTGKNYVIYSATFSKICVLYFAILANWKIHIHQPLSKYKD